MSILSPIYPSRIKICRSRECVTYPCCNILFEDISLLIYKIGSYLTEEAKHLQAYLKYGIGSYNAKLISVLNLYSNALQHEAKLMLLGIKSCLTKNEICRLVETASRLLPIECYVGDRKDDIKEIIIGYQGIGRSVDTWNKFSQDLCKYAEFTVIDQPLDTCIQSFKIDLEGVQKGNNSVYEALSRSPLCNITFKVDTKDIDCKAGYTALLQEGCELSYKFVTKLIECGLTFEVIQRATDCGYSFATVSKEQCEVKIKEIIENGSCDINYDIDTKELCVLMYRSTEVINLCGIQFNNELNVEKCLGLLS